MQIARKFDWDQSPSEAKELQKTLAREVKADDRSGGSVGLVAGLDVAYEKDGDRVFAAVVVLDAVTHELVESSVHHEQVQFPYVPGLFAFREIPPISSALAKLKTTPDLIVCDGQGVAHPRRFGLASHVGLMYDVPTIGCGKTCLIGEYDPPSAARGSQSKLIASGDEVGRVLRTQDNVNPLFVSVGHLISADTACSWILKLAKRFRQPEPIRLADQLANQQRKQALESESPKQA